MNIQLEQHTITGTSGEYTRTVWVMPGPQDKPHPLYLFLDAELYLHSMQCLPILGGLVDCGAIPAFTGVFVSHVSGAARHADLTCNDRYTKFIAEDVVRWVQERDPFVQAHDNRIVGLSLSGLAAAYIAFRYASVFSGALCQSGSFWWLADREISLPPTSARFWLSVGDQETDEDISHPPSDLYQRISQIAGVEAAAERFAALGGEVKLNRYSGGHAIDPWREELAPALAWL